MNKRADEIRTGDVLGDMFLVDSVYQPIGNPNVFFAWGRSCGIVRSRRFLGKANNLLTVREK